jgi:hypothetical protein
VLFDEANRFIVQGSPPDPHSGRRVEPVQDSGLRLSAATAAAGVDDEGVLVPAFVPREPQVRQGLLPLGGARSRSALLRCGFSNGAGRRLSGG